MKRTGDLLPRTTRELFPSALNMLLSALYLNKLFPMNRFFGREHMAWRNKDRLCEVDVVSGCFMMIRRQAVEQVGVMDEAFFMYAEETDWCYRFKKAGWKVLFTPDACIIHLGRASSQQVAPKMRLQLSGSVLYFLKKHKGTLEYVLGCVLTALFFLIRIPGWLVRLCVLTDQRSNSWTTVRTYVRGMIGAMRGYRGLWIANQPVLPSITSTKVLSSKVPQ
jgi:GT2 family glycosyltransferase